MSVATSKDINPQAVPSKSFESVKAFIEKRAVLTYFVLVFILSWGTMLIVVGPDNFPLSWEQFEKVAALVYISTLLGPCLAGVLMTGLIDGRAGFRDLSSRLLKWRVGAIWYVVALLTIPLLTAAINLALSVRSPEFLPGIFVSKDKTNLLLLGIATGLMVGLFEEIGWTGFAVPRLRLRHSVLATGVVVGLVWGAWHFLLFWEDDSFSAVLPFALLMASLFSWLPAYRVLMVWVYDRTGSLLVAMLMHVSLVVTTLVLRPMEPAPVNDLISILVRAAALWLIVAVVSVANRGQVSRQSLVGRLA